MKLSDSVKVFLTLSYNFVPFIVNFAEFGGSIEESDSINHVMREFSEGIIGCELNAPGLKCTQVHLPFIFIFFSHSGNFIVICTTETKCHTSHVCV